MPCFTICLKWEDRKVVGPVEFRLDFDMRRKDWDIYTNFCTLLLWMIMSSVGFLPPSLFLPQRFFTLNKRLLTNVTLAFLIYGNRHKYRNRCRPEAYRQSGLQKQPAFNTPTPVNISITYQLTLYTWNLQIFPIKKLAIFIYYIF